MSHTLIYDTSISLFLPFVGAEVHEESEEQVVNAIKELVELVHKDLHARVQQTRRDTQKETATLMVGASESVVLLSPCSLLNFFSLPFHPFFPFSSVSSDRTIE